ncbi:DivIVA domain-containing protein [Micromonospora sp. M51]|uniref:DivIVA domain-containing protein n=1 Tax=Micromonospora sp. M51 TaxID=2824889 RepID=UPI001B39AC50|nr:DivIVA domain-containing protein [Micromonospora sp. M51]MBQ1009697.1 DivIVA domain-containing protein [Micromonospora sp. M51]
MASQGQRFRRKALRRGYKVDEVDAFLDRVEATLDGRQVGAPVASQEVHDVVFRVRFNGYDEWQVDLHLDRVERQLAELEERNSAGRGADPRMGPPDRMGPPMRDDRGMVPQPMPPRPMPAQAGPPYGRYDEPTGAFAGGYDAPRGGGYDAPRGPAGPPMGPGVPMGPGPMGGHGMPQRGLPAGPSGYGPDDQRGPGGYGPDDQRGGYDPDQVDRFFETLLGGMQRRNPMPVDPKDLDTLRFGLVPGGYFEAEVDAALKDVQDILFGR